nr:platelet glycoprotein Ib alpha chain-like [Ipomoea batatas]
MGKVIPRFERKEERVHERIDENVQAELSDESLKKVTSVLRKMGDTVVEFAEVMAEIGNTRTGGGIIKRTFENIAEMINGVSSSQPPQQQGLLDDDDIFNQPSFLDAVSALEQAFLQTRKNYAAQPAQPTTSQSQQHIQTPSFDLGVPSPQPAAMEQPQDKIDSTELRNIARDLEEDSENTIFDEQQLDTTPADNTMKELFDRGLDMPKRIFFSTQAFLQLDSPTNWERGENTEQSSYQTDFEQCLDTEINNVGKLDISDAPLAWTDCGLYCMRQMETYMGNPQWKCGFTPKNPNDPYLASLRALYTSRIIMMPVNVHKANVIRNAEEHFIGKRLLQ